MMNFALQKFTDVFVRSVNIRAEMHGEDPVPAIDIGLRLVGSNTWLNSIDPALKSMLYRAATDDDDEPEEPELDGIDPTSDTPVLRCAVLDMPVALKREYSGYTLVIDYGLGGKSNITVADCTVNNFKVEAKEGGTVEIDFRVQASGLDGSTLGRIGALVKHDVAATLHGPEVMQADAPLQAAPNPFKFSAGAAGGITDNHPAANDAGPVAPDAGDIFAATVLNGQGKAKAKGKAPLPLDATELPPASAASTASFKARADRALKAAAGKAGKAT